MKVSSLRACMLTVLGLAATLPSLSASIIGPGAIASPDVFTTTDANFVTLAGTGNVNVNPAPGTSFNATYQEYVVRDSSNTLCGVPGQCLSFIIYVSNAGPGVVERVSTSNFGSFITDVGYNTANAYPGIAPATVDRSATGGVIGFNFNTGASNINAGQNSARLEIQTNATAYTAGTVSIQDGFAGFGAGFAPTAATPEPASMLLFGSGLIGIGISKKLRRKTS